MTEQVRPPFVLVFAGDLQGCGYHRCAVPLMSMVMPGYAEGRLDLHLWTLEMIKAARPDTIVFQRYLEDPQVKAMQQIKEALPDTLLVYELDDYLGEIPKKSFHSGFMPPGLPEKIAKAAAICHRVTTSTEPLAHWFREELKHPNVLVLPNAVPAAAVRPRAARPDGQRLRVGFAGGVSHDGDLELIRPAMEAIGDEVEWVFFGMQPKNPPVRVEFHPGVQPSEYQVKLLQLDLDLVLAPLEENQFNECKSNLRLIEAGMIGACAIVQDMTPYTAGNPPIFGAARTPDDWTTMIRGFMTLSAEERQEGIDALQKWVLETHTLEHFLPQRREAWLHQESIKTPWKPMTQVAKRTEDLVVASRIEPVPSFARNDIRKNTLEEACHRARAVGADVLWMRPGTSLSEESWESMRQGLMHGDAICAALPMSSDGPNGVPRADGRWTPVSERLGIALEKVLRSEMPGRKLVVRAPSGPAILLSARTLAALGIPDVAGCAGNEEQAILEWGLRAAMRGWKTVQSVDAFAGTTVPPEPPPQESGQRMQMRGYGMVFQQQQDETLTAQERADMELELLREMWSGLQPGVAGFDHTYQSWAALSGALDNPDHALAVQASLSVVKFGAASEAEWTVFIDDSVEWKRNGLATLRAAAASVKPGTLVVYADHEILSADGSCYPDFKPDFDLEMYLARDYVTPVCAIRTDCLPAKITSRTDLYSVILNIAEEQSGAVFHHIEKRLAIVTEPSPEDEAVLTLNRQMALESYYHNEVKISGIFNLPGKLRVERQWNAITEGVAPKVSIIIPTRGEGRLIQPCVATLLQHTEYPNFEIVIAQNGERTVPELSEDALNDPRVKVVFYAVPETGFSWSQINNDIARNQATGEYLCFMNDDVTTGTPGWLDAMMGHAVLSSVGTVGAKLIHPQGILQHVGVVCHKGVAGHIMKGLQNGNPGSGWIAALTHESSAVTGACMLVSRRHFEKVNGFDTETFPMNYSDTDFCLKLRRLGLRNVVEVAAELLHPEGTTRTTQENMNDLILQLGRDNAAFAKRWPHSDPYWHPDLAIQTSQGGLQISGLNRDLLMWQDKPAGALAKRVLLINDLPGLQGQGVARTQAGEIVMTADVSALTLRLTAPIPANIVGWDLRTPENLSRDLKRLGVNQIVLRSLIGSQGAASPIEALRCLAALNIRVDIDPIDPATVAPWLAPPDSPIAAIFGTSTDMDAWQSAYEKLVPVEEYV